MKKPSESINANGKYEDWLFVFALYSDSSPFLVVVISMNLMIAIVVLNFAAIES